MTVLEILQLASVIIATLTFMLSLILNFKIVRVEKASEEIKHSTNSLTEKLVEEVRVASIAKGKLQHKENDK